MRVALGVATATLFVANMALAEPASIERGPYIHLFGTATIGESLRLNNPYRLERALGSTYESVSLGASYSDLGLGALFGEPFGLQHGVYVHLSQAIAGIAQDVFVPSYVAYYRSEIPLRAYGRFGVPLVLAPDANAGLEIAAGGVWMITSGIGANAELGTNFFYGAATRQVSATLIPLVYGQAGVVVDFEVLP